MEHAKVGPWVWFRRSTWRAGELLFDTPERFYIVRVDSLEVRPQHITPIERDTIVEHRWWSVDEIQEAAAKELFVPRRLGELLVPIVAGDIPKAPIDTGI